MLHIGLNLKSYSLSLYRFIALSLYRFIDFINFPDKNP